MNEGAFRRPFLSSPRSKEGLFMQKLYTKEGRTLPQIPWNVYPRPQMVRKDWLCLNGKWSLEIRKTDQSDRQGRKETVLVPFCPESLLSGIQEVPEPGDVLLYRKSFVLPDAWHGRQILLHFGAVSRDTEVLLNGKVVCRSKNGYLPFSADVTEALAEGENDLEVRAVNDLSHQYPWGKQSKNRGGMWYTPCSGIWQTVWLEPVPEKYIQRLKIRTGSNWAEVFAEGIESGTLLLDGWEYPLLNGKVHIPLDGPKQWSPEDPFLYRFCVISGEDRVESYFALRTLTMETVHGKPRLCLNGKPYFFHALLDQGYWSDGLYTPADAGAFERDILSMKALGFNTLRKHIKIEPELFYYACDSLGMVVFQDMVNNGEYRYLRDTVLPTLHFQKRRDRGLNRDPETRKAFLEAMKETVSLLENHPSICLWTIFNEGWGQFCADDAYELLKKLDPTRFIDSTSGWYHQKKSDVDSLHIYFEKMHLGKKPIPQLLSEFGGYVWKVPEHSFNREKTYGYKKFETREAFVRALRDLYEKQILLLASEGLCGAVYTQVSDVEDETNGLLTFDRVVSKLQPEEFADLSEALQRAVESSSSVNTSMP